MTRLGISAVGACLALLIAAPSGLADISTSGLGKNTAMASLTTTPLPKFSDAACPGTVLTAYIAKGIAHRLLAVESTIAATGNQSMPLSFSGTVHVNGVRMEPTDPGFVNTFGNTDYAPEHLLAVCSGLCSTNASTWLDLDAAEAAHPGTFIGKPLAIALEACSFAGDVSANLSLVARLERR